MTLSLVANHVIQEASRVTLEMEANPVIASKTINHQKRQNQVQVVRPDIKTASARIHEVKIKHIRARLWRILHDVNQTTSQIASIIKVML